MLVKDVVSYKGSFYIEGEAHGSKFLVEVDPNKKITFHVLCKEEEKNFIISMVDTVLDSIHPDEIRVL